MPTLLRALALAAIVLAFPASAFAKTHVLQPFPTNLDTVADATQVTGVRVDLPTPDCAAFPSDCADVAVLNTLDGFNIQPRITIPFSSAIDTSTVSSQTVFLVGPGHHVVGINQAVWEPLTNTLHVESDQQLAEATTYLLVVTRDVRDTKGRRLDKFNFSRGNGDDGDRDEQRDDDNDAAHSYRNALRDALAAEGLDRDDVAAASLFTTQSITAISRKIRSQLQATPVSFVDGGIRDVFPLATVAGIDWNQQKTTNGPLVASHLPTAALFGVGTIAFGTYASPDYENAEEVIPPVGSLTGTPAVQSINNLQFTVFLPVGAPPPGGWPVAIFGHGFTDSKNGAPIAVAGTFARNGIATIAINVVGHGFGAASTYTVLRNGGAAPVTLPAGGRGFDQDQNGTIDSTEGVSAVGAQTLIGSRDGLRQTVVDIMQLVKELKAGIDVDGNGTPDLSTSRIYYSGQSFGGIYGTQLLGLEPDIRAGVPNVAGGSIIEVVRLGGFRPLAGLALLARTPSLYNATPNVPFFTNFNENMPLRNLPLVVDTVPGAEAIADLIDNTEWAQQAGNPAAYAPDITHPVIFQFARGDETVPNPTTSAILRACGCANRATLFRNDLAHAAFNTSKNPHTFLTNIAPGDPGQPFAFAAQQQIATFFASDGLVTIDPDGAAPFFETPASIVPEDLAFIP
ncbi:MAG: Ig-like domain-containing protein [Gaiellaceae bacterium]